MGKEWSHEQKQESKENMGEEMCLFPTSWILKSSLISQWRHQAGRLKYGNWSYTFQSYLQQWGKVKAMAGSGFWRWGNIEKGSPRKSLRVPGEKPKERQKKVLRGAVVINAECELYGQLLLPKPFSWDGLYMAEQLAICSDFAYEVHTVHKTLRWGGDIR